MASPDISVSDLSHLSALNIVEKLRTGDGDQLKNEGSIRIGSKTYKVTYVPGEDGATHLQMKRNYTGFLIGGFLNWVHRNDLTTQPRAVELTNKVNDLMKSTEYKLVRNTYDKLIEIAKARSGDENGVIEVGNYGHSEPRNKIQELGVVDAVNRSLRAQRTGKSIRLNKIDTYNTFLGVTSKNMEPDTYRALMSKIASGDLKPNEEMMNYEDNEYLTVDKEDLQKWRTFISNPEIAAKIDIPKKLYGYLHQPEGQDDGVKQTGWKQDFKLNPDRALRHFVIKNMSAKFAKSLNDDMINTLCTKLREYVEAYNEPDATVRKAKMKAFFDQSTWPRTAQDEKNIKKLVDLLIKEKAKELNIPVESAKKKFEASIKAELPTKYSKSVVKNTTAYLLFANVLVYATFRQTSKIGLDFFKEQNKPILFHMSNRDLTDFGNPDWILNERHWKDGQIDPTYGGSEITHSEVRHADKLIDRYGNAANIWQVQGA